MAGSVDFTDPENRFHRQINLRSRPRFHIREKLRRIVIHDSRLNPRKKFERIDDSITPVLIPQKEVIDGDILRFIHSCTGRFL